MVDLELTPDQLILAYFIYEGDVNYLTLYINNKGMFSKSDLEILINKGLIVNESEDDEFYFEYIRPLEPLHKLFQANIIDDPENWIDEYYNLFPEGIKTGGSKLVKSGKLGCLKKLRKFMKDNPSYDKDIILEATKRYVAECASKGYQYMMMAPYFIEKDGVSSLEGYCQMIYNNTNIISDISPSKFNIKTLTDDI